jgi:hypothetical protein
MYNSSNYESQTVDTFEILGGFVINIFYNHIYDKACELHTYGKASSKTEAYKLTCRTYLRHFSNTSLFKQTLKNINEYFNLHSPIPLISYSDWVDRITKEFVPSDFWSSLSSSQKDHLLGILIEDIYKKFSIVMMSPRGLEMVIDNHKNKSNITFLQDRMLTVMIEVREHIYSKFVKPLNNPKSDSMTERLRNSLIKETQKTKILKDALEKASSKIKAQDEQIQILLKTKDWLMNKARALNNQLEYIQEKSRHEEVTMHQSPVLSPTPTLLEETEETDKNPDIQLQPDEIINLEIEDTDLYVPKTEEETPDVIKQKALQKRKEKISLVESKNLDIEHENLF